MWGGVCVCDTRQTQGSYRLRNSEYEICDFLRPEIRLFVNNMKTKLVCLSIDFYHKLNTSIFNLVLGLQNITPKENLRLFRTSDQNSRLFKAINTSV